MTGRKLSLVIRVLAPVNGFSPRYREAALPR
jgi:hypothetical protein